MAHESKIYNTDPLDDMPENGLEEAPWYDTLYMLFILIPVVILVSIYAWFYQKITGKKYVW